MNTPLMRNNSIIINTEKIDNGDGIYTINDTYQYTVSRTEAVADIEAQIATLQAKIASLPVNAIAKIAK